MIYKKQKKYNFVGQGARAPCEVQGEEPCRSPEAEPLAVGDTDNKTHP